MSNNVSAPKHHWLKCTSCGSNHGVKWRGIPAPVCENCLMLSFDFELRNMQQ